MKKFKKIIISILLIAMIMVLASCEYANALKSYLDKDEHVHTNQCSCSVRTEDGYTGGLTSRKEFHDEYEVYWLETYGEVLAAVELLKSHGSTVTRSLGFNYESDLLDSKYCFVCKRSNADPLEEGKSFFDRKIDGGTFSWYGFYEDITIEELLYKEVYNMDVIAFAENYDASRMPFNVSVVNSINDASKVTFYCMMHNSHGTVDYQDQYIYLSYEGEKFAKLCHYNQMKFIPLPVEHQCELLDTFVVVE